MALSDHSLTQENDSFRTLWRDRIRLVSVILNQTSQLASKPRTSLTTTTTSTKPHGATQNSPQQLRLLQTIRCDLEKLKNEDKQLNENWKTQKEEHTFRKLQLKASYSDRRKQLWDDFQTQTNQLFQSDSQLNEEEIEGEKRKLKQWFREQKKILIEAERKEKELLIRSRTEIEKERDENLQRIYERTNNFFEQGPFFGHQPFLSRLIHTLKMNEPHFVFVEQLEKESSEKRREREIQEKERNELCSRFCLFHSDRWKRHQSEFENLLQLTIDEIKRSRAEREWSNSSEGVLKNRAKVIKKLQKRFPQLKFEDCESNSESSWLQAQNFETVHQLKEFFCFHHDDESPCKTQKLNQQMELPCSPFEISNDLLFPYISLLPQTHPLHPFSSLILQLTRSKFVGDANDLESVKSESGRGDQPSQVGRAGRGDRLRMARNGYRGRGSRGSRGGARRGGRKASQFDRRNDREASEIPNPGSVAKQSKDKNFIKEFTKKEAELVDQVLAQFQNKFLSILWEVFFSQIHWISFPIDPKLAGYFIGIGGRRINEINFLVAETRRAQKQKRREKEIRQQIEEESKISEQKLFQNPELRELIQLAKMKQKSKEIEQIRIRSKILKERKNQREREERECGEREEWGLVKVREVVDGSPQVFVECAASSFDLLSTQLTIVNAAKNRIVEKLELYAQRGQQRSDWLETYDPNQVLPSDSLISLEPDEYFDVVKLERERQRERDLERKGRRLTEIESAGRILNREKRMMREYGFDSEISQKQNRDTDSETRSGVVMRANTKERKAQLRMMKQLALQPEPEPEPEQENTPHTGDTVSTTSTRSSAEPKKKHRKNKRKHRQRTKKRTKYLDFVEPNPNPNPTPEGEVERADAEARRLREVEEREREREAERLERGQEMEMEQKNAKDLRGMKKESRSLWYQVYSEF